MKHRHFQALRDALRGSFELLAELEGSSGQTAYLATSAADGALVLLIRDPALDGDRDLEEVRELSPSDAIGCTYCWICGTDAPGWPRICTGCDHGLSGAPVPLEGPGALLDALEQDIRTSWPGWRLLGAMPYAGGGGVMYFAQADKSAPVVGFVIDRMEGAEKVVACWASDETTLLDLGRAALRDPERERATPPAPEPAQAPAGGEGEGGPPPPRRRVAYGVAAALLIVILGTVAFAVARGPAGGASIETAGVDSAVVPPDPAGSDTTADTLAAEPEKPRDRPGPVTGSPVAESPAVQLELPPPPDLPDPEVDRRQVLAHARQFATAFGTKDIVQVRAAYPGISAGEQEDWARWFQHRYPMTVRFIRDSDPQLHGDSAKIDFTLLLRFARQRPCRPFHGTLRRSGGDWYLERLNAGTMNRERCQRLHQEWDGEEPVP